MNTLIKCKGCFQLLEPSKFYPQKDSPTLHRSKCKTCYNRTDYLGKKRRKALGKTLKPDGLLVERNYNALLKAFKERTVDFNDFRIPTKFVNGMEPMSDGISFKEFKEGEHTVIVRTNGESAIKELNSFPIDHIAEFLARNEVEVIS